MRAVALRASHLWAPQKALLSHPVKITEEAQVHGKNHARRLICHTCGHFFFTFNQNVLLID